MFNGKSGILRWAAGLAIAGIAGLASPGTAGARLTVAAPPAYTLELEALLSAENVTDVCVRVIPANAGVVLPTVARQIRLKSFAPDGTAFWSKSYLNGPLDAQGKARFRFTDLHRDQPIQAQVTLQTSQMVKAQVYRVDGLVLYRPDLEVLNPAAPPQVMIFQPVIVQASIHDRNGDVGATCDVVLLDAANSVLDTAAGVVVPEGGTVAVLLTTQFPSPGTYTLTVEIRDSNPTEFDAANDQNNRASVAIAVVATIPTDYSTFYVDADRFKHDRRSQWDFHRTILRFASEFLEDGEFEHFSYNAFFPTPPSLLSSAAFEIEVASDNTVRMAVSIPLGAPSSTSTFDDGLGNTLTESIYNIRLSGDESESLFFYSAQGTGDFSGRNFSSLSVQHNAHDYIYFSYRFDYLFGESTDSGHPVAGVLWQARSNLHTNIRVVASDGTPYGGQSDTGISFFQEDAGPISGSESDETADYYIEFFSEYHLRQWSGSTAGTTD